VFYAIASKFLRLRLTPSILLSAGFGTSAKPPVKHAPPESCGSCNRVSTGGINQVQQHSCARSMWRAKTRDPAQLLVGTGNQSGISAKTVAIAWLTHYTQIRYWGKRDNLLLSVVMPIAAIRWISRHSVAQ